MTDNDDDWESIWGEIPPDGLAGVVSVTIERGRAGGWLISAWNNVMGEHDAAPSFAKAKRFAKEEYGVGRFEQAAKDSSVWFASRDPGLDVDQ